MKKKARLHIKSETLRQLTSPMLAALAGGRNCATPTFPTDSALAGGCGVTDTGCGGGSNQPACC